VVKAGPLVPAVFHPNVATCGSVVDRARLVPTASKECAASSDSNHTVAANKFSDWHEASDEQVVRGFLRVLRLPPFLQMTMVQPNRLEFSK
jgi:hypothetical protein